MSCWARAASSTRVSASDNSSSVVYRPKPIRMEDRACRSESPIARSTWLGRLDPLAQAVSGAAAWPVAQGSVDEVTGILGRLRTLEAAGLDEPWKAELEAQARVLEGRPYALLLLGEGVSDAGHAVEGIRIGRRLLEMRGGAWDEQLLRLAYAAAYHWDRAAGAGPENAVRADYLVSRALTATGQPDRALVVADRALAACDAAGLAARPGWQRIRAVREGRVCAMPPHEGDVIVRPGPRLAEAARLLAKCIAGKP